MVKPPPIPDSVLLGVTAEGEDTQVATVYRRKDESEVVIPEWDLVTELTEHNGKSAKQRPPGYEISWVLPDVGDRGVLERLDRFHVRVVNEGLFTVQLVAQYPLGYSTANTSVAGWVLLKHQAVRSGGKVEFVIRPTSNSFVTVLRSDRQGKDCLVVCAISVARQGLNAGGTTDAPPSEVGLRISVQASYASAGSGLGAGKYFSLRTVSSDEFMYLYDHRPPVPVAVRDIAGPSHRVAFLRFGVESRFANRWVYLVPEIGVDDPTPDSELIDQEHWVGLDKSRVYTLPVPCISWFRDKTATLSYIKWLVPQEGDVHDAAWCVVRSWNDTKPYRTGGSQPMYKEGAVMSSSALLTPVAATNNRPVKVPNNRKHPRMLQSIPVHRYAQSLRNSISIRDDALDATTIVVGVEKAGSGLTGVVGPVNVAGVLDGVPEITPHRHGENYIVSREDHVG